MIDLPDVEKVKQAIPTDYEAKEIVNLLLEEALHFKILYILAMYTGRRRGELCTLKWSDITIANGVTTMVVSRSRSSLPGCGVDKQTVADLAGHGDTSFLERTYFHPQTILKQKAAVALSNTLFGGSTYMNADGVEQGGEQAGRIA